MSSDVNATFRVQLLNAVFKLCLQKSKAGVLTAHNQLLENTTAMYPFVSSDI